MLSSQRMKRYLGVACLVLLISVAQWIRTSTAAEESRYKTAGGLTVYLGVMPAQIVKGHPAMHGGTPRGAHQYHVVVAIFDAVSGVRISDAAVAAKVSGLGLSGPVTTLEPMKIADTTTYGTFVNLPGTDLYTIELTIRRSRSVEPVIMEFKYDHRRE